MSNTIVIDSIVYRREKEFTSSVEAINYATILEKRLSGEMPIAETATISRETIDPNLPIIHDLILKDIEFRRDHGLKKYKIPLQPFDGNDPLVELYQEMLDKMIYFRMLIFERIGH
jgi:hypothetical protein